MTRIASYELGRSPCYPTLYAEVRLSSFNFSSNAFWTDGRRETHNPFKHLRQKSGYIAIIDSLELDSKKNCQIAPRYNDFELNSKKPWTWVELQPKGIFFDARKYNHGIYSNAGYLKD